MAEYGVGVCLGVDLKLLKWLNWCAQLRKTKPQVKRQAKFHINDLPIQFSNVS